jgi:hypothetical protein
MAQHTKNPILADTIAAIGKLGQMRAIVEHTPEKLKMLDDKMTVPVTARLTGVPSAHNPHAFEDRIITYIDRMNAMRDKCAEAQMFLMWFESSWAVLCEEEQEVLFEFYGHRNQRSGATWRLCKKYYVSERTVEYRRAAALKKLAGLLFDENATLAV